MYISVFTSELFIGNNMVLKDKLNYFRKRYGDKLVLKNDSGVDFKINYRDKQTDDSISKSNLNSIEFRILNLSEYEGLIVASYNNETAKFGICWVQPDMYVTELAPCIFESYELKYSLYYFKTGDISILFNERTGFAVIDSLRVYECTRYSKTISFIITYLDGNLGSIYLALLDATDDNFTVVTFKSIESAISTLDAWIDESSDCSELLSARKVLLKQGYTFEPLNFQSRLSVCLEQEFRY